MNSVTVRDFKDLLDSGEPVQIIDVREEYEYEQDNLGGELIPMGDILFRQDEIARDKKVVVYCRTGSRSTQVIKMLELKFGFDNLYNLEGGLDALRHAGL